MGNIIKIKHGNNAPGPGILQPYELGYSRGKLFIGGEAAEGENQAEAIGLNFVLTPEDEQKLMNKFEEKFLTGKW